MDFLRKKKPDENDQILFQQFQESDEDNTNKTAGTREKIKSAIVLTLIATFICTIIFAIVRPKSGMETTEVVFKDAIESSRVIRPNGEALTQVDESFEGLSQNPEITTEVVDDLNEAKDYLDELEKIITENRNIINMSFRENDVNVIRSYNELELRLMSLITDFDRFTSERIIVDKESTNQFVQIRKALEDTRREFFSANSGAITLIRELSKKLELDQDDITKLIGVLKNDVESISEKLTDLGVSILDLVSFLNEANATHLSLVHDDISKLINDNTSNILDQFSSDNFDIQILIDKLISMNEQDAVYLKNLHVNIVGIINDNVSNILDQLAFDKFNMQILIDEKMLCLSAELSSIHNQIYDVREVTVNLINEMESSSNNNYVSIFNSFSELSEELLLINNNYNQLHEEILVLHNETITLNNSNYLNLAGVLEQLSINMEKSNTENFVLLLDSIKRVDAKLGDFDVLYGELGVIAGDINNLENATNSQFGSIAGGISNLENSTSTQIGSVADSIINLESTTSNQLGSMTNNISNFESSTNAQFGTVANSINNLGTLTNSTNTQLGTMANSIGNLENLTNNQFSSVSNSITQVGTQTSNQIISLADRLNLLEQSVNNNFTNLEKFMIAQWGQLPTESLLNRLNTLEASMNGQLTNVNNNLTQLFQSVSDGKSLLAAALLTKGQTVAKTAPFVDFYNAILRIETGSMNGDIEYIYHYHTTINGGCTATNNTNSLNATERAGNVSGGCFHVPRHHIHTGNTTAGGGCHGQRNQHTHNASCNWNCPGESRLRYNSECNGSTFNVSRETRNHICGRGNGVETWNNPCGGSTGHCKTAARGVWRAWGSDNCVYIGCGLSTTVSWSINCGMTVSTIEAMRLGCGRTWNEIVEARIRF